MSGSAKSSQSEGRLRCCLNKRFISKHNGLFHGRSASVETSHLVLIYICNYIHYSDFLFAIFSIRSHSPRNERSSLSRSTMCGYCKVTVTKRPVCNQSQTVFKYGFVQPAQPRHKVILVSFMMRQCPQPFFFLLRSVIAHPLRNKGDNGLNRLELDEKNT